MAKVTLNNLDKEIRKILDEYGGEVEKNLESIVTRIGQTGAQTLRNESKKKFKSSKKHKQRYSQTWTYKANKQRLYTVGTIYNRQPGLPHLLEHGHALVAGGRRMGRVEGKIHIAPVEQRLIQEFEREVKAKL